MDYGGQQLQQSAPDAGVSGGASVLASSASIAPSLQSQYASANDALLGQYRSAHLPPPATSVYNVVQPQQQQHQPSSTVLYSKLGNVDISTQVSR